MPKVMFGVDCHCVEGTEDACHALNGIFKELARLRSRVTRLETELQHGVVLLENEMGTTQNDAEIAVYLTYAEEILKGN